MRLNQVPKFRGGNNQILNVSPSIYDHIKKQILKNVSLLAKGKGQHPISSYFNVNYLFFHIRNIHFLKS